MASRGKLGRSGSGKRSSGQPAESPRMGAGGKGPPSGRTIKQPSARYQLVQRLAIEADVRKTVAIFDRADYGQTWDLFDLYDDGLLRDSRLDAVSRKRVLAIQAQPFVLEPPVGFEQDAEAKEIAERCKTIVTEQRVDAAVGHLADGVLKGLGVCEIDWRIDARGWYVPRLGWRHQNLFGWTLDLELGFRLAQGSISLCPLSDYPDKFVVHQPLGGRSTYPMRMGALRTRILPSQVKRNGVRWWAILLERWGQPQVFANQKPGDGNDDAINDAFKSLSEYWQAVFPEGVDPKAIPMSGQISSDAHARFVELANTDDAITILGQNLTTEVQGGSYAATVAHSEVADVILRADLAELSETLTSQLIEPIVRYNWPGAPVPRLRFVAERAQAITVEALREGLFTEDEFRAAAGHSPKPDGSGAKYRTPPTSLPQGVFGLLPPGGAAAADPFASKPPNPPNSAPATQPARSSKPSSAPRATMTPSSTPTSGRSRHPLASALSPRSGE